MRLKISALLALFCLTNTALAGTPTVATIDGRNFDIRAHLGQWVLVNYWATWCGACIEEMPHLSQLATSGLPLAVIGLTDEPISPASLRAFMARHRVAYPVALLPQGQDLQNLPSHAFGLNIRPISYLVRPDGHLARRFLGEPTEDEVEALITPQ